MWRGVLVVLLVIAVLLVALGLWFPRALARRRLAALIDAGDVKALLRVWHRSAARVADPGTALPLLVATAYASFGWVDEARSARGYILPGDELGPSREQIEFVDVLLEVYEGDRRAAVRRAEALVARDVPNGGGAFVRRVRSLRRGLLAIARAFAHEASADDAAALVAMRTPVPILTWPLRYAEAIVAIDRGDLLRADALLSLAPRWPENSVFHTFHRELSAIVRAA
jgi:hypothetical protein